ncbi:MAG: rhodanese-like domain-containing protein [Bacteroidia bacterium]|nr:rhodanese-like domain-containing protein [Bacteroidia bacterium]NNJ56542.1 rhodanese-like domain-containing protein [Bacteroidia bacterium]
MEDITVLELKEKLDNKEDILVIDVREEWEYQEFNIGAKLIPLAQFQGAIDDLDDWMDKEVIVHCKTGARSAAAKAYMQRQGFNKVRNLLGGMVEWQAKIS